MVRIASNTAVVLFTFLALWLLATVATLSFAQSQLDASDRQKPRQISEYVRKVFQDKEGQFWFGTNNDGVARYDGKSLRYYTTKDGLAGGAIRGILQDQSGAIWIATDGGVSRYFDEKFESYTTDDGLSDNDTWSISKDATGTIWVGTKKGVCRWMGKSFVPFPLPPSKIENPVFRFSPDLVWSIHADREGNIWFGTDGAGAYRFNGKEVSSFTKRDGLLSNQVSSIVQDRNGVTWFGFMTGGMCSFDGTSFRHYGKSEGLADGMVWTVLPSQQGELLVSVLGTGVHRFVNNRFQLIDANTKGLPTHAQSLMEDRLGYLWVGCSGGLYRIEGDQLINVTTVGPWPKRNKP